MGIRTAFDLNRHRFSRGTVVTKALVRAAAETWRQRHVAAGHDEYDSPLVEDREMRVAYINHGRWLVDCPCGNGPNVSPVDASPEAVCFACGTVWTNVLVPVEHVEIERVLSERKFAVNQNWRPGENVEDLVAEAEGRG